MPATCPHCVLPHMLLGSIYHPKTTTIALCWLLSTSPPPHGPHYITADPAERGPPTQLPQDTHAHLVFDLSDCALLPPVDLSGQAGRIQGAVLEALEARIAVGALELAGAERVALQVLLVAEVGERVEAHLKKQVLSVGSSMQLGPHWI